MKSWKLTRPAESALHGVYNQNNQEIFASDQETDKLGTNLESSRNKGTKRVAPRSHQPIKPAAARHEILSENRTRLGSSREIRFGSRLNSSSPKPQLANSILQVAGT